MLLQNLRILRPRSELTLETQKGNKAFQPDFTQKGQLLNLGNSLQFLQTKVAQKTDETSGPTKGGNLIIDQLF